MLDSNQISPAKNPRRHLLIRALIVIFALLALSLALLGSPWLASYFIAPESQNHSDALAQVSSPTPTPFQATATPTATPSPSPSALTLFEVGGGSSLNGLMVLSMSEYGYSQLFSHQLVGEPFTRLTQGNWDDIHPALSPDGEQIAFVSNRGGNWDLYLLDLSTGQTIQLSDDPDYDGHPTWSADGAWLAYEHYSEGNLEVYMRLVDGSVDPVVISANTSIDHSPAWRPGAQQIAFVSERSGIAQIWIVDLEQEGDERFRVISESSNAQDSPAWSPEGKWLAWSQDENGIQTIFIIDISDPDAKPIRIGVGLRPQWNSTSNAILAEVHGPNETYLTGYDLNGGLALAPELLPGHLDGFTWGAGSLPDPLPNPIISAAQVTPSANLAAALDSAADDNSITNLVDVNAPFEQIHDSVLIPFEQLRIRAGQLLGWDALSELQNAYVPLGEPLPPDRQQDWLFTGRAFELHSALIDASWMAIVREELDGQTYWRVYLLAANDEGGLGRPMTEHPWVLSSRFNNTESAYISGGALSESIPAGYWIDFTALASEFGFERVPALGNWRSYYQGALFNLFVLRAGLSWGEAMLQIYSPEELATIQP